MNDGIDFKIMKWYREQVKGKPAVRIVLSRVPSQRIDPAFYSSILNKESPYINFDDKYKTVCRLTDNMISLLPPGAYTHAIELIYRGSLHDASEPMGAFRSSTFYKKCKEAYAAADKPGNARINGTIVLI